MTIHNLPAVNATLNGLSAIFLAGGFIFIKRGNKITGTISVLSSKADTFSEQDIQILTDLAESIQLGVDQITYRKELSEKNKTR